MGQDNKSSLSSWIVSWAWSSNEGGADWCWVSENILFDIQSARNKDMLQFYALCTWKAHFYVAVLNFYFISTIFVLFQKTRMSQNAV